MNEEYMIELLRLAERQTSALEAIAGALTQCGEYARAEGEIVSVVDPIGVSLHRIARSIFLASDGKPHD